MIALLRNPLRVDPVILTGIVVVAGHARVVVIRVGSNTSIGSIHDSMLRSKDEVTPLTNKLDEIGNAWACGKQLKQYPAFCRNGTTITIQSFVFVMAKEGSVYVAYLEDINNEIKPFDLSKLRGSFDHPILSDLAAYTFLKPTVKAFNVDANIVRGTKRTRNFGEQQGFLKVHFGAGQHWKTIAYEPLCQDIKYYLSSKRLFTFKNKQVKVQYDDLEDQDGCGNLEEWVLAFRLAAPDKLGVRCSRRSTIRLCPPNTNAADSSCEVGALLDAWWSDEWWEGIIAGVSNGVNDRMQVYIPSENLCELLNLNGARCKAKNTIGEIALLLARRPGGRRSYAGHKTRLH
ncbi:hypothetical protein Nepgr_021810 [Nepenthes gracilis]|uniref:Agenet-like domain-containing protein n=1 Tax=Nepenthes gracilis TaxID=150966 RepID=A0AAD3SZV6_NEPGR|nr:hypothetical protein Nepgr_021810 [Nepenthes gracilis]